jgi:rhomboid protease GluP
MWQQRWRWKLNRYRTQWEAQLGAMKNLWQGAQSPSRMCPSCRALVGVSESQCLFCGAPLRRRPSGVGKFLQNFFPQFAPVSYTLLTINFVLFILMWALDGKSTSLDIRQLLFGGNSQMLLAWGADAGWLVAHGQWWRLVSAMFIHIGLIHLLFNCYALLFIGPLLEEILGRERFLVLYLATGVAGFWLSNLFHHPVVATAGASGAIFGLIGAALVLSRRYSTWGSMLHQQLKHWAIYGLVYGFLIGANNSAHIGGLLAGAGLALLIGNPSRFTEQSSSQRLWRCLYGLGLLVCMGSLLLALYSRLLWLKI